MMINLKVSVIVPVYNSEIYLRDCLESLLNQTLTELEIILVDDASTDKSIEIMAEYKSQYPKIKIFKSEQNKGQGASRNIGMSLVTGEYIGFLDSDDYVAPTMYENLYNAAKENNADIVTTRLTFVKDSSYLGKIFESNNRINNYTPLDNPKLVLDESGKVDPTKIDAFVFDQFQNGYYRIGEKVGTAWNSGMKFMNK